MYRVCYWCKGTGREPGTGWEWEIVRCSVCGGEGMVPAEPEPGYVYRWWL